VPGSVGIANSTLPFWVPPVYAQEKNSVSGLPTFTSATQSVAGRAVLTLQLTLAFASSPVTSDSGSTATLKMALETVI